MKSFHLPAWIGLLLFVLCAPAAAQVYKCQGAGGRIAFSDKPCATEDRQVTVKEAPPPGHVDVDAACRTPPGGSVSSRRAEACMLMRLCATEQQYCDVYCRDYPDGMLPGVRFGPASAACLARSKYLRGKNWVQTKERERPDGILKHDKMDYACIDATGRASRRNWVLCEPGTNNCTSPRTRNGHLDPFVPLDALLTQTCAG